MWVEAVLSRDDLAALIAQIVPLTICINPATGADHYIELATATDLALVADQGLRMTTKARIHWPLLGITVPITIDPVSVMIRPRITGTPAAESLSFTLEIEHADFAGIPAFGDQPITDKINSELGKAGVELAWAFAAMLSHRFAIPPVLEPLESLALNVAWGKVRVTDEAMVLAISFHAQVSRRESEAMGSPRTSGSDLGSGHDAELGNPARSQDRTSDLKLVALAGGAVLAAVGTYFTMRGAGRVATRLVRRAFR